MKHDRLLWTAACPAAATFRSAVAATLRSAIAARSRIRSRTPAEDDPETPRCTAVFRPPGMFLEGVTMFAVAEMLSTQRQALGRIVEDRTGLTGRYKMELEFQFAPLDPDGPSLFTAVRKQWGLKLGPAKGPAGSDRRRQRPAVGRKLDTPRQSGEFSGTVEPCAL
jgi:hypothetical protein